MTSSRRTHVRQHPRRTVSAVTSVSAHTRNRAGASGDFFHRTEGEAEANKREWTQATYEHRGYDSTSQAIGDVGFAPGDDAKRFRAAVARTAPKDDIDRHILASLEKGPMNMGRYSNPLLYGGGIGGSQTPYGNIGRFPRFASVREKTAVWRLVKGGQIMVHQTLEPNTYWLVRTRDVPV